jgi:hypothetical protein
MPPTDDARNRILGEVQALRSEILRVRDRHHAREIKRKVLELQHVAIAATHVEGSGIEADVAHIVDGFVREARETLVAYLGTAAWDEPETVEQAKARMGKLPAAPGSEQPPLTDAELESIAHTGVFLGGATISADRLVAELRRLRSDEWLNAAAADYIGPDVARMDHGALVAILRKHRDGRP